VRAILVASIAGLALACAQPAPPPAADAAPTPVASTGAPRAVALTLRDATVDDVLTAVSGAAGQPIAVDTEAQPLVRCARMTLLSQAPVAGDELAKLVAEALEPSALTLTRGASGAWIVRRRAGAPLPATCAAVAAAPADEAPTGSLPPARSADPAEVSRVIAGIRRVSDAEVEVTQSSFDRFLDNSALFTRSARVVPAVRDGTVVGMKLFGIRADGVMAALGFLNGDTVTTVDKHPLVSPDAALEAYSKLKHAKSFGVGLERAGKPHEIRVRIVPDPKPTR
jgi:hypothetical protein